MPPKVRSGAQTQPITTTLKGILEFYGPETCLREVLQNADDAHATLLELNLDTNTYESSPLIDPELEQFSGPALLAYNDAEFSDRDFQSISQIGSSLKIEDALATGKFGRGFNSLYHWTDAASVWSRDQLLIQDPHHSWTAKQSFAPPGGLIYEIDESPEMQNQMQAFSSFGFDTKQQLKGTIVRIPLRTERQAAFSKISLTKKAVTRANIIQAFTQFSKELRNGGNLLFLKSITSVRMKIDNKLFTEIKLVDGIESRSKCDLIGSISQILKARDSKQPLTRQPHGNFQIQYTDFQGDSEEKSETSWLVQHEIRSTSKDESLDEWATGQKLFPWVAVALPLHTITEGGDESSDGSDSGYESNDSFNGHLFSTLKLPIPTKHPCEIHGLFSITPDRSRLTSLAGEQNINTPAAKWNEFLFSNCVVECWINSLHLRRRISSGQEGFHFWPRFFESAEELWQSLGDKVTNSALIKQREVWNTSEGCLAGDEVFFSIEGQITTFLKTALKEIHMPVSYVNERHFKCIMSKISKKNRGLSSTNVWQFISKNGLSDAIHRSKLALLEYCLEEIPFYDLQRVPFWPSVAGGFLELGDEVCFWPRKSELNLFAACRPSRTVDIQALKRVGDAVMADLTKNIVNGKGDSILRYRCLKDFPVDWKELGRPIEQSRTRTEANDKLLLSIWQWIQARYEENSDNRDLAAIASLLLVPLTDGSIRQLGWGLNSNKVTSHSLVVLNDVELYQFFKEFVDVSCSRKISLVCNEALDAKTVQFFFRVSEKIASATIYPHTDISRFLNWATHDPDALNNIPENLLREFISKLRLMDKFADGPGNGMLKGVKKFQLKSLKMFNIISSSEHGSQKIVNSVHRSSLNGDTAQYFSISVLPHAVPNKDLVFVDLANEDIRYFSTKYDLVKELDTETLLKNLVIPWVINDNQSSFIGSAFIDFIFSKTSDLSLTWPQLVSQQPLVPVQRRHGSNSIKWICSQESIDPTDLTLSSLFFDDEPRFVASNFFRKHKWALRKCGIISSPSVSVICQRIQFLAECNKPFTEIVEKFESLIGIPLTSTDSSNAELIRVARHYKWIPAIFKEKESLHASHQCRKSQDQFLVDSSIPVACNAMQISARWMKLLSWNIPIGATALVTQLKHFVDSKEKQFEKLKNLTDYILRHHPELFTTTLEHVKFIRGSSNHLYSKANLFTYSSHGLIRRLSPYFDTPHDNCGETLVKSLELQESPSIGQILKLQSTLAEKSKGKLNNADLDVSIASIELAVDLFDSSQLFEILVPNEDGILLKSAQLTRRDRDVSATVAKQINFVHPKLSRSLQDSLGIETAIQWQIRTDCDLGNFEDEDEYAQEEDTKTIIANTLERYTLPTFMGEYLANADDSGATEMKWMLDDCEHGTYPSKMLLCEEMRMLQGPAAFSWNNQKFADKDWDGFKNIGVGSKTYESDTIGVFGRGSLSGYHLSENPMVISGKWLLVLDPGQTILLRSTKTGQKKKGIKVLLADAFRSFPDILESFEGVFGFDNNVLDYNGTIFRFPFRPQGSVNHITGQKWNVTTSGVDSMLSEYVKDAASSLLFLRNVQKISYSIRNTTDTWSIQADKQGPDTDGIVKKDITIIRKPSRPEDKQPSHQKYTYWIIAEDLDECPKEIVNPFKRQNKVTEISIAIFKPNLAEESPLPHRYFCTLPTTFKTEFNCSINASFAITSDRETIPLGEVTRKSETLWNTWLLKTQIPRLWIYLLESLARSDLENCYNYWPSAKPSQSISTYVWDGFWEMLKSKEYRDFDLFPVVKTPKDSASSRSLVVSNRRQSRKFSEPPTSLAAGTFNVCQQLICGSSFAHKALEPLLKRLCPTLVRIPYSAPPQIHGVLRESGSTIANQAFICGLLKQTPNSAIYRQYLDELTDKKLKVKRWNDLIDVIFEPDLSKKAQVCELLDGCPLLPLQDGSFANIKVNPTAADDVFLLRSEIQPDVFDFADDKFIEFEYFKLNDAAAVQNKLLGAPTAIHKLLGEFNAKKYNVRQIEIQDVAGLLNHAKSPLSNSPSPSWLEKLWSLLRSLHLRSSSKESLLGFLQRGKLGSVNIIGAYSGKDVATVSLDQISSDRSNIIYKPRNPKLLLVFHEIEGLWIANTPTLADGLTDLSDLSSFKSLLKRIYQICYRAGKQTPEQRSHQLVKRLSEDSISTLRELMLQHYQTISDVQALGILKILPIFPRFTPTGGSDTLATNVSLSEGLAFATSDLFHPWTENLSKHIQPEFVVNNQNCLKKLGKKVKSSSDIWNEAKLTVPQSGHIIGDDLKNLISVICQVLRRGLSLGDLAIIPDMDGNLRNIKEFYDFSYPVFEAVFRDVLRSKFIHPQLRQYKGALLRNGMHGIQNHGYLNAADFLQCVNHMKGRPISNQHYIEDCRTLVKLLNIDSIHFHSWPSSTWSFIAQASIFPLKKDYTSQPSYRRNHMEALAASHSTLSPAIAGRASHMAITWSQTAYLEYEIVGHVYGSAPQNGAPSPLLVLKHLKYLVGIRDQITQGELSRYLGDLEDSYSYLQDNLNPKVVEAAKSEKLFFNLSTAQKEKVLVSDLEESLIEPKRLCIRCPSNPKPYVLVDFFLSRYEKLLSALGSQQVIEPEYAPAPKPEDATAPDSMIMNDIRSLRNDPDFCDIQLGVPDEPKTIGAHRVVLASRSDYFKAILKKYWGKKQIVIPDPNETSASKHFTLRTLQEIIDFCYTGIVSLPNVAADDDDDRIADKIDKCTELLYASDFLQMPGLKNDVETFILGERRKFVRPDNVREWIKTASECQAKDLNKFCKDFEQRNHKMVENAELLE